MGTMVVEKLVVVKGAGRIDGVVNNAGNLCDRIFLRISEEEWRAPASGSSPRITPANTGPNPNKVPRRMMKPLTLIAAAMSCTVLGSIPIRLGAEPYPVRPIRILDGFPAGGGTDYLARVIGRKLTEQFGQTIVVDNRPGAAGNVAAEIVARANPDGYTLFMALTSAIAPSPSLYPRLAYDPLKDFSYVTLVASGTYVLLTHPSTGAKTVTELVALAKAKPGALRYGSSGVAGPLHLAAELLKVRSGVELLHVPYKGAAPVVAALTAGEVQTGFASLAAALPMIKANRLNALAVTGARRTKVLPDLPTIAESGVPGFDVTPWYGIVAPAQTPAAVVKLLNAEIGKVLPLPDVQASLAAQGMEAAGSTPERFRTIMSEEISLWARVIKEAGIKPD